ncbi:MAG: ankyrin repeat domain-containing protein [Parachlamydiales bacterium]
MIWELVAGQFDRDQYLSWCMACKFTLRAANSPIAWSIRCYAFFPVWTLRQRGVVDKELFKKGWEECQAAFGKLEAKEVIPLWGSSRRWDNGHSLLFEAMCQNLHPLVDSLIEAKLGINLQNKVGVTPLILATLNGNRKLIRSLCQAGGSLHLADDRGSMPLFLAVKNGDDDLANELLKLGADPHFANPFGTTPLWVASAWGREGMVARLLEAKADPNACDNTGSSPLFSACQYRAPHVVAQLLSAGANPNLANNEGATPLLVAYLHFLDEKVTDKESWRKVIALLIQAKAAPDHLLGGYSIPQTLW